MFKKFTLVLLFFTVSHTLISEPFPFLDQKKSPEIVTSKISDESILFVGDIMLGRYVETLSKQFGSDYTFKSIKPLLFESTYVIANLEGPLPENHTQTPNKGFGFSFETKTAHTLSNYHISAVSLANNHTSDQGQDGYTSTVKKLLQENIPSFGNSRYFLPNFVTHQIGDMSLSTIGINLITPFFNEKEILFGVKKLCEENPNTNFIAFIHAGTEYTHLQSGYQVNFAHKLIDETCLRLIVGSHPHVVQGVEKYKGKFIFYSLGNFIFDQYFSEDTQNGVTLSLKTKENKLLFTLLPVTQKISVPSLSEGQTRIDILDIIASSSSPELKEQIRRGFLEE